MKKKNCLFYGIVALAAVVLCAGLWFGSAHKENTSDFMSIEGQEVSKEEYQMVLSSLRAQVASGYSTEEANQDDFWEEDGEDRPLQRIMGLTLEKIKEYKTAEALAKELGLPGSFDYESLKEDYLQDAEKRENRDQLDETIYGPDSLSFQSYYTYRHTALFSELEEALKGRAPVSEEKLRQVYEERKDQCTYSVQVETIVCELSSGETQMAGQIGKDLESKTMPELKSAYPGAQFYELTMNDLNTQSGKSGVYSLRWEVASQLQENQVSEPFAIGDHLLLVKCIKRSENEALPYEEVKGILKSVYQTEQVNQEMTGRIKAAQTEYNEQKLKNAAKEALAKE